MKKVSAIIVCCLLVVALIALPVLAAQTAVFTATASKNAVTHGEEFTVTYSVSEIEKLETAGYMLSFDTDRFEYVKYTKGKAIKNADFLMGGVNVSNGNVAGYVMYPEQDKAGEDISGELIVVTFKVKATAPTGDSVISCNPNATAVGTGAVDCSAVGATITITCNHSYGATWTPDGAQNHKQTCSKCGEPKTEAHTFGAFNETTKPGCNTAGEKVRTCSVCGYEDKQPVAATNQHVYGAWTKVDETNHKRTCTTCVGTAAVETKAHTFGAFSETTKPGCNTAGEKTATCECGAVKTEPVAATNQHVYGAWTKVDETNHKRTCTTCVGTAAVETKAHTFGEFTETTPADCLNPGEETATCECGATKTRPIPSTGDHGFGTWTKLDDEYHTATCTGCGVETKTEKHIMDAGVVTKPADCKETGIKTFTCTAEGCGHTTTEIIEKSTNHTYGAWTKQDDEKHVRTCSVCGNTETAAHVMGNGVVTKPADCKETGIKTFTCECGHTTTEIIEKTNDHTFGAWTKQDDEKHVRTCSVCGTSETDAHVMGTGVVTKPADCKETGIKTFTCECGHTTTETIEKTNEHTYGAWENEDAENHKHVCSVCGNPETAAHAFGTTKYDENNHWTVCTDCGVEKAESKAAHAWDNGVVTKKPTNKEEGEKTFTCACGATKVEKIDKVSTPATGDNTLVIPMVILAVLSACGLAVTVVARKRASR